MATPYQVPSLSDIMYTRSRTPTPQQVTLNNLMSFLKSAQQIKAETEAERSRREFTVEREREERAWRSSEEAKRASVVQDNESRRQIERRVDKIRADRERAKTNTTNRANLVLNHVLRDIDSGRFERAKLMANANEDLFTDADMGQFYDNAIETISSGKEKKAGARKALNLANQVVLGNKLPSEFLLDNNTIEHADNDAYNLVYNHMSKGSERIEHYKQMKYKSEWNRLTADHEAQAKLHYELSTNPSNYDEKTGVAIGSLASSKQIMDEQSYELDNYWPNVLKELEPELDKDKTLADFKYGPNQTREALRIWIEAKAVTKEGITDSTGKRMKLTDGKATEAQVDGFMGLITSGKLRALQTPQGFLSDFLTFDQWTKMGFKLFDEDDDGGDTEGPAITAQNPGPVTTSFGQAVLDTGNWGGTFVSLQDEKGEEFAAIPWKEFESAIANNPYVRRNLAQIIGTGQGTYGNKPITYEQVQELVNLFIAH